jgi:Holliday junction DNA helicase RuvA
MIAHVHGTIAEKVGNAVIVDVHGLGYEVQLPLGDYDRTTLGETVKFYTYHHIREQSQDLFGFSSLAAKKLFELLITVQGIGPKAALAILSLGDGETVRNAIANSDTAFISKASGIGKKSAERVVVDLSDKVGLALRRNNDVLGNSTVVAGNDEALEALMALGYTLNDATKALEGVSTDLSTAERVTQALRN